MPKHISNDIKNNIVEYYKSSPMTLDQVSEKFNISIPSIIKILDAFRIKRYSKAQLFSPNLDENYFETIDTEYKAYFLGLIISDGCVHNTKGRQNLLSITLQDKDRYLLSEFLKEIGSNKKITNDGRGCSEISILSNKIVYDLKKYGVVPNKSLYTIFPFSVPDNLRKHLIRGIIDGDGSISYYSRPNRKSHTKAIRLCQGNEQFLIDVVNCLYDLCGAEKVNTYKEKDNLWSIAYRKTESIAKIIDCLYSDANIYMIRKKHICDLIFSEIIKYGNTEITNRDKGILVS